MSPAEHELIGLSVQADGLAGFIAVNPEFQKLSEAEQREKRDLLAALRKTLRERREAFDAVRFAGKAN